MRQGKQSFITNIQKLLDGSCSELCVGSPLNDLKFIALNCNWKHFMWWVSRLNQLWENRI